MDNKEPLDKNGIVFYGLYYASYFACFGRGLSRG